MGGTTFTQECYLRDFEDLNMQRWAEGTVWAEAQDFILAMVERLRDLGETQLGPAWGGLNKRCGLNPVGNEDPLKVLAQGEDVIRTVFQREKSQA